MCIAPFCFFLQVFTASMKDVDETAQYFYHHVIRTLQQCLTGRDRTMTPESMVENAIRHPLVSPKELFTIWKAHRKSSFLRIYNMLAARQVIYEQFQLFLGRYLLYVPTNEEDEEHKTEKDPSETQSLFEITLDIDNVTTPRQGSYAKKLTIKQCKAVLGDGNEYVPLEYEGKEAVSNWDVVDYDKKILKLENQKFQWFPCLDARTIETHNLKVWSFSFFLFVHILLRILAFSLALSCRNQQR